MIMSNISATIQLYDRVSAPINSMIGAINNVCYAFESVERSMDGAFNTSDIDAARSHIQQASAQMTQLASEIENTESNQNELNDEVRRGAAAMDTLTNKVMGLVGAYVSLQGVKKLINLSDEYTRTAARLGMIVDEQNTVAGLQDKIFGAAQRSRASYSDMADMVAKLSQRTGDMFKNDEAILFAENLNKLYKIAGASQEEMHSSQLQLMQAMGSGVLRGEEFNAVFEAAPNIMQIVADYMDVPIGKLREMAANGQITADVVKNAMLGATNDINAQFEQMPMTWADVWTGVMNELYIASQPILEFINLLAQNWSILEPIVIGLAVAVGLYTAALLVYNTIQTVSALITATKAAAEMMATGATFAATAAQYGFNAALLACPLTWILILIIAIIAVIYAVVAAINQVTGTTISATGLIVGTISAAISVVWNLFLMLVNLIIQCCILPLAMAWDTFANFFGNIFNDPIATIIRHFEYLAQVVLGILKTIANAIDAIFGSNLSAAVSGWVDGLSSKADALVEKYGNGSYEEKSNVAGKIQSVLNGLQADFSWDTGSAFNSGYKLGEGIGSSVSDAFGGGLDNLMPSTSGLGGAGGLGGSGGSGGADNIGKDVKDIAGATEKMAGSMEITNEELKYLRDIAERDVVNRFTTAEIKVEMSNNNTISSEMDLDGIVNYLVMGVNVAMEKAAEGVHI